MNLKEEIKSNALEKHEFENRCESKLKTFPAFCTYEDSNAENGIHNFSTQHSSKKNFFDCHLRAKEQAFN